MKLKQAALLVLGLLPLGVIAQANQPQITTPPGNHPGAVVTPAKPPSTEMPDKDKLSYAIGMYFGGYITNSIKRGDLEVDFDTVAGAVKDVITGKPTRFSEKELSEIMNQLKVAMQAKQRAQAEEAKAKGDTFLSNFAKGAGVTTVTNGLEYKVIKEGDGAMPKETDRVTVAYRGTLIDGTEFDHNDSFPTAVRGRIIQGWQRILPLMKVGSKWQVAISPAFGYGAHGMPPKIPANSVLVFDLELKSIEPAPTPPPTSMTPPTPGSSAQTTAVVSGEIIKVPGAEEMKHGAKIEVIKAGQTNVVNPQ